MNSENNSLIRNDMNTERDHPLPILMNSLTLDDIKKKVDDDAENNNINYSNSIKEESVNDIVKNLDNMETTQTDMLFHLLADDTKLVQEEDRK